MKYNGVENEFKDIENITLNLNKKVQLLDFIVMNIIVNNSNVGEEELCRYELSELWKDYEYHIKKSLYYIHGYIEKLKIVITELLKIPDKKDIDKLCIPTMNSQNIIPCIYDFDSMIISISSLIDGDWKNKFCKYFNSKIINNTFPTNKDISLFWELNIIRNRIVHPNLSRYDNKDGECRQFITFTTFPNNLIIEDENLKLKCIVPDMYNSPIVQEAVKVAVKSNVIKNSSEKKINVIDILFPEISASGKSKQNPIMVVCDDSINYDHITSSIRLLHETLNFIDNIVNLFYEEFIKQIDISKIENDMYVVYINDIEYKLKIKDIFK